MTGTRSPDPEPAAETALESAIRDDWARILAGVFHVAAGDLQLAEDAVQDAAVSALQAWRRDGVPESPSAWLITAARRKAIDRLRRGQTLTRKLAELQREPVNDDDPHMVEASNHGHPWPDDRLRLIFTCCHPSLAPEAQIGLTLRVIGGLTTAEIARGFLVPESALAKRLTRAKQKVRDAGIPYKVPEGTDLPNRLGGVLRVLYLIFNEGYSSTNTSLIRLDLCDEAIRLARMLLDLLPGEPEVNGLLSLMLLNHSPYRARTDADGELLVLEEQDRTLWDQKLISEGSNLLQSQMSQMPAGSYQLQAAIAALHAEARTPAEVDWEQIAALYTLLLQFNPTRIVELNRASAIGMALGPDVGLMEIEAIAESERLDRYHYLHAARADFLRRAGRDHEAIKAYETALAICTNPVESRYLERRLREVMAKADSEGESN